MIDPLYILKWVIVVSAGALAFIGILRLSMTAMGFRVIQSWDNHFDIKIPKLELGIRTKNLGVAIIVLELLFLFAYKAIDSQNSHVALLAKAQAAIPVTAPLPSSGYSVAEETTHLDLTNRKQLSVFDWVKGELSRSSWKRTKVIKRIGNAVEALNFRHATSGPGISVLKKPQDAHWSRSVSEVPASAVYNPFVGLLSGEFFSDLKKRKGRMQSYYLTVPAASRQGQEISYSLQYHNAFQGENFEWAGNIFSADTDRFTMFIAFPPDKPYTSFAVYKKGVGQDKKVLVTEPNVVRLNGHALKWRIDHAKKGEKYYIKWTW